MAPHDEELSIWWGPIPGTDQEPFFDDDTPEATLMLQGGYASGKTMTLTAKMLKLSAINDPIPIVWTVPDWGHVEDTILETLQSIDEDHDRRWFLEPSQFHHDQRRHRLEWDGGGPIQFASANNPDSIAGPNVAAAGTDEPGKIKHVAWRNTVARVRHPFAKLRQVVAAGTPEGLNWLADLVDEDRPENVHIYRVHTQDNRELLAKHPGYIDQLKANSTEAELEAYLAGKVTNMSGTLAYGVFDAKLHYRADVQIDPRLPLRVCWDFNVDPLSCVVAQHVPGPEVRVITSIVRYNATTDQVATLLASRFGRWGAGYDVYGDATGQARSTLSNESNYDVIKRRLSETGSTVRMHVPSVNPPVALRLNSVNAMLLNARREVRIVIKRHEPRKTCPNRDLVRSLQRTVCRPGTKEILKKAGETDTHPGEALGYYIAKEFPAQTPSATVAVIKAGQRHTIAGPRDVPHGVPLDRELLELAGDVMKFGSAAVIRIRRLSDPTFTLPEHLRGFAPGGKSIG